MTNKQVTTKEYKELVNQYWNGEITMKELDEYEIVLEKQPTHASDFINNLIIKHCDDMREEKERVLYIGSSRFFNTNELRNNGFEYISDWSNGYREVFISSVHNAIVTTCEGDLSVSLAYSNEAYTNELERAKEFYDEY